MIPLYHIILIISHSLDNIELYHSYPIMVPLSMVIIYNGGSPITVIIIPLSMMVPLLPYDTIKSIIHIISFISILYHSYPYYITHIHIISFISILYHSFFTILMILIVYE